MHSELTAIIARQHVAELTATAERYHHLGSDPGMASRPSLRTRLGWRLVRWGQRLAPPPSMPSRRPHPATMGA
jgi:hypothetical protein